MTLSHSAHAFGPRFAVLSCISQGPASTVYEVRDRFHGTERALKVATRPGMSRRFRSEFKRLVQLRHPNIVRAYDFGWDQHGAPYYTLELVHGKPLQYFEGAQDAETLAHLAMQVLDALAVLHARGFVHRDITPSNILISGTGAGALVRIVDFGLLVQADEQSAPGGTPPYVAPEVARGDCVDGRADLYSLGAVLYEILTQDDTALPIEELSRRLRERPVPPHERNPLVPRGLSRFVSTLLEPRVEDRFQTCEQAARFLGQIPSLRVGRIPARVVTERMLRGGAVSHRSGLSRKCSAIARHVQQTRQGVSMLVRGDIGVGKTPFLRELGANLNLCGFHVMHLSIGKQDGSLIPAMLNAANELTGATSAPAEQMSFEHGSPAEWVHFTVQALRPFHSALLIEDIERGSPLALEFLRLLGQCIAEIPSLLVLSADSNSAHNLDSWPAAHQFDLQPLKVRQVQALVKQRLNGLSLPMPAIHRLTQDSQGMPSLVERTLARMLQDGMIRNFQGKYVFVGGRYRAATHGDVEGLLAQSDCLTGDQQQVLWACAVLGNELNAPRLAYLCRQSVHNVNQTLAELARIDILRAGETKQVPAYKFASRALATRLYQKVPARYRKRLHDRAAELLEHFPSTSGRREAQLEHLLRGSNADKAIDASLLAGQRALDIYANDRAVEYYGRAYARCNHLNDARALELALRLGNTFQRMGELERAAQWYETAAATSMEPSRQQAAKIGLGSVHLARGELERALCLAEALIEEDVAKRHPSKDIVHQSGAATREQIAAGHFGRYFRACVALKQGKVRFAEQALEDLLSTLDSMPLNSLHVQAQFALAEVFLVAEQSGRAAEHYRQAARHSTALNDRALQAQGELLQARILEAQGAYSEAIVHLGRARRLSRLIGDRLIEAIIIRHYANVKASQGHLRRAHHVYVHALEQLRLHGARSEEASCLLGLGTVCMHLGDFAGSALALEAAADLAQELSHSLLIRLAHLALARLWTTIGAQERAQRALTAAGTTREIADQSPGLAFAHTWLCALIEARRDNTASATHAFGRLPTWLGTLTRENPGFSETQAEGLMHAAACALQLQSARWASYCSRALLRRTGKNWILKTCAQTLRGKALRLRNANIAALVCLQKAAARSGKMGLRAWEIDCLHQLWHLESRPEARAEAITTGMERARQIATQLPLELLELWLTSPSLHALRDNFQAELHSRASEFQHLKC